MPTWNEHLDVVQVLLVLALGYIVWSFRLAISEFQKWQRHVNEELRKLWDNQDGIHQKLCVLIGEHNARHYSEKYAIKYGRRHDDKAMEESADSD